MWLRIHLENMLNYRMFLSKKYIHVYWLESMKVNILKWPHENMRTRLTTLSPFLPDVQSDGHPVYLQIQEIEHNIVIIIIMLNIGAVKMKYMYFLITFPVWQGKFQTSCQSEALYYFFLESVFMPKQCVLRDAFIYVLAEFVR